MLNLICACAFFLFIHFGVSGTRWRDALVARLGAGPYRGVFSIASLLGLVWMIYAYRRAPLLTLWTTPRALEPLAFAVVLVAFLLGVIGLATRSPTAVGAEAQLQAGANAARGVLRITRHPFLWGVALWSLMHLIMNGDQASLALFGTLLLLSLGGTASIDAKRRRSFGAGWAQFAQATSAVPFAAILGGRNRLGPALREIGVWRPLAAVLLYLVIFHFHGRFFGVPLR